MADCTVGLEIVNFRFWARPVMVCLKLTHVPWQFNVNSDRETVFSPTISSEAPPNFSRFIDLLISRT